MKTEILEGNKLIAAFMGYAHELQGYSEKHNQIIIQTEDGIIPVEYHSSWDWLMPVVERIEDLGFRTNIEFNGISTVVTIGKNIEFYKNPSTKINKTYMAIVAFVKWYNSNKNILELTSDNNLKT